MPRPSRSRIDALIPRRQGLRREEGHIGFRAYRTRKDHPASLQRIRISISSRPFPTRMIAPRGQVLSLLRLGSHFAMRLL